MGTYLIRFSLLAQLIFSLMVHIQAQKAADSLSLIWLDTATVTALRQSMPLEMVPVSIALIDSKNLRGSSQGLSLEEQLWTVPGLLAFNGNNFTQDLRLSMRGFGARAAFGIRGVRLLLDGFPETTSDGQGQVDNIDPSLVQSIEIVRGPLAMWHGNASGGLIEFRTMPDWIDSSDLHLSLRIGAFGYRKAAVGITIPSEQLPLNSHFSGAFTSYDGFRQHAVMRQWNLNAGISWRKKDASQWGLRVNYVDSPWAEDPGALTLEQAEADPSSAWGNNVVYDAGEKVRQLRTGFFFKKTLPGNNVLEVKSWYTHRQFANRLPFQAGGIVELRRHFYGATLQFSHRGHLFGMPWQAMLGLDADRQDDQRQRFDNLQGTRGDRVFGQREQFANLGLFASHRWQWAPSAVVHLGFRLSELKASADDEHLFDGDQSGSRRWFQPDFFGGLNWKINAKWSAFGNVSTTFETPTLNELSNNPVGTGGFNPHLSPQRATSLEAGVRKRTNHGGLITEASAFHILIDNELVPYELAAFPGRTFYRNTGKTRRIGLELATQTWISGLWRAHLAYTFSLFKYLRYEVNGRHYDGNIQPGIPRHSLTATLGRQPENGLLLYWICRFTSGTFADDANSVETPKALLIHLRTGWRWEFSRWCLEMQAGMNNLTNARWYDNIRINAFGGRFYKPGPGRHVYGGIHFEF